MKKIIRNTTVADRILFLLLLIASIGGLIYTREAFSLGTDVLVEVNGKPAYTLSLDYDAEIPVAGAHGHAVLEIKNSKVRLKEADCANQICVKQGWISHGTIVCMPNHIVVTVGGAKKKDIDAITG